MVLITAYFYWTPFLPPSPGSETPVQTTRYLMATKDLVENVDDAWNNTEVRINQRQAGGGAAGMQLQREWTKAEDRYLLCLTHL